MRASELPKILITCLTTALLTGVCAWFSFGADRISRTDMEEHISNSSPWLRDRGEITAGIKENTRNISRLESACQKIAEAQQRLAVDQQVLLTKLEALLRRQ